MKKIIFIWLIFTFLYLPLSAEITRLKKTPLSTENARDYSNKERITGDTCEDPFYIPSLPYSDSQNSGDFANDYDEECPYTGSTSPDVVYEYTPSADQYVNVTLCNDATAYDTKLYVYTGICPSLVEVPCNDDACSTTSHPGAFVSELTNIFLSAGVTYFIVVDGYGGESGIYDLYVENTLPGNYQLESGTDYWSTVGHGETLFSFGSEGDFIALPADFFGPGSDPFEGQIFFEGDPSPDNLGGFDTVSERTENADFNDPLPDNVEINTLIDQMTLKSVSPIEITFSGVPSLWEVELTLSASTLPPNSITEIRLMNSIGGGYNCEWYIAPFFTFREIGGTGIVQTSFNDLVLMFLGPLLYPSWNFSLIGNEFDPQGILELETTNGGKWTLEPVLRRTDGAYASIAGNGDLISGGGSGYEGTWYQYPEADPDWWNIWFYDHPYDPNRSKLISGSFFLSPIVPSSGATAELVFNWTTPEWSLLENQFPPLPDSIAGVPEANYIVRSGPIFSGPVPDDGITINIPSSSYLVIQDYNPEWISIDIRGSGFYLEYADISHVCYGRFYDDFREYGDAPEGDLAYPSTGVTGNFPTCSSGTAGYIIHDNHGAWLGPFYDFETDGNAGMCPGSNPDNYNLDECFADGDAGLLLPDPFTITGDIGSETVVPCSTGTSPLGFTCETASWGTDIDIDVHNTSPNQAPYQDVYLNLLIDWNQDGEWDLDTSTTCEGDTIPEHVLEDFVIPALYIGPVSSLLPPDFKIGPYPGYVWCRFSITESPVGSNWNGEGSFEDGETEDYLLFIDTDAELDFGDLPDTTYPTLLANNGARHIIDPAIYMGSSVDAEFNGQPSLHADGDDMDGNDDEDGVGFNFFIPGQTTNFGITISVIGYLNAWVDWNDDGDWDDLNEQVATNEYLEYDMNTVLVQVPSDIPIDTLAARFRFTDYIVSSPSYDGLELNGEVEDYLFPVRTLDFGDAPDSGYPTLSANFGAQHLVGEDLYLGQTIDGELDGIPTADALGDDNSNLDDEDGVSFPVLQIGRVDSITVQVNGNYGGFLYTWIDWNQNGSWEQLDEYTQSEYLAPGIHKIPIRPPYNALPGETYARCRLTSSSYCYTGGFQYNGEVEDYVVTITDASNIKWGQPPSYYQESDTHYWGVPKTSIYGDTVIVADDWLCSNYLPVTEIHWWGTYPYWSTDNSSGPGTPTGFHLGIWTDSPSGGENLWSHPDSLIWEYSVPRDSLNESNIGWYMHPEFGGEDPVREYTLKLSKENWFYQMPPVGVYWLSIAAIYNETPIPLWGWVTRGPSWNDAAVTISNPTAPVIGSGFITGEPITDLSQTPWDMSFVLISDSEAPEAPEGMRINVYQDSSLVKIEWTAAPDARYYVVYSSTDPYATFPSEWTVLGITSELYWNDGPPLPMGETKFYKVASY